MRIFMEKIGVIAKPHALNAREILSELILWLKEKKKEVYLDKDTAALVGEASSFSKPEIPGRVDMIIVMGGDGTFLSVARLVNDHDVPIFGVNMGGLGFLTEVTCDELYASLERILSGEYIIDERLKLNTTIYRNGEKIAGQSAVNDIVINKGAMARMIDLEVHVDGKYVTRYKADGLIVSTPTGSTAYSLAAGGPILYPTVEALILNPICPHTLTNRPLVIPDHVKVEINLISEEKDVYVTVDGQVGFPFQYGDRVLVTKSDKRVKMILSPEKNYFEVLRKKLMWGERI